MRVGICYYLARPLGLRPLPDIARYAAERGFLSVLTQRATRVSALSAATAGLANLFVRMNSQLNTQSKRFRFPLPRFIKRRATQHQHAAAAGAKQQAAAPGLLSAATKPLLPPLPLPVPVPAPTANNSSSILVRCANDSSSAAHRDPAPTSVSQLSGPTAAESSSCLSTARQTPAQLGLGIKVGFGFDLGLGSINQLPVHVTRQSAGPDSGIVPDVQSGATAPLSSTGDPQSAAVAICDAGVGAGEALSQPPSVEEQQQQCSNCEVRVQTQYLRRAVELLDVLTERVRLERRTETVRAEWKFAARVVDRLCLAVFAFLTIFFSIIVLFSAPGARL